MAQILQNKNLATRFQILIEVAANQPDIQQKDIARKLNVTPQAISEYMEGLIKDGWIASDGRSKYMVTKEGTGWVLKMLRELEGYSTFVKKAVTNITICAAVAGSDFSQGQAVGLEMKNGLLVATEALQARARGIAAFDAKKGEDIGVSNIEGIVKLKIGEIIILEVPGIRSGGSRSVDLTRLRRELGRKGLIGAIGIEAMIALEKTDFKPQYFYGVTEAAIEAAHSGLSFLIVCIDDEVPRLLQRLREASLDYELIDLKA